MTAAPATPEAARPHAFAGSILLGAQSRLLPYHIPLRFFLAAAVFQVAAWGLLAVGFDRVPGFAGGTGLVLAGLHALTLGVLAMTAMGASFQLLGVATGVAMRSYLPCRLASWLFIPGTAVLVAAMAVHDPAAMAVGGGAAGAGLAVYAYAVADIVRRAAGLRTTVRHVWGALAALVLLVASGGLLIADFRSGVLGLLGGPSHGGLALFHAIVAIFGFMGLLALGFSYVLVPMFALAAVPSERAAGLSLGLAGGGLGAAAVGALNGIAPLLAAGAALGLASAAVHLGLMAGALTAGMKKRLGLSFVLVRAAWALLAAGLAIGFALGLVRAGLGSDALTSALAARGATLFGFAVTFGWLLTFLTGVLQRILPFLASMHAHALRQRAPRLSELGERGWPLKLHAAGHGLALALAAAGIGAASAPMVLAGALAGVAGALAFLWFALDVARRIRAMHTAAAPNTDIP